MNATQYMPPSNLITMLRLVSYLVAAGLNKMAEQDGIYGSGGDQVDSIFYEKLVQGINKQLKNKV